jgi:hypothetical protein
MSLTNGMERFEPENEVIDNFDKCPDDPWGRHRWYQTTLAEPIKQQDYKENDGRIAASHACRCGRWRLITYPKPKHV